MLTREQIKESERLLSESKRRLDLASTCRAQGGKAGAEWHDACVAWHAQRHPVDFLWSASYFEKLRDSDQDAISDAILYLECDPWYHRSGYLKAKLVQALKSISVAQRDRSRLRNVILNVVTGRNRCEFRKYCSLARVVGDEDFLMTIRARIETSTSPEKGKLIFLFEYLQEHGMRSS